MVRVDLDALRIQADTAKKSAKQAREALQKYQQAIHTFQGDNQLKGQAYKTAKAYCEGPLTSLLIVADAFYEEAGLVLGELVNQYESKVDTKSWDSEDLQRLIEQVDHIIIQQEHAIEKIQHHRKDNTSFSLKSHHMVLDSFKEMKHRFELILQHLEAFSSESALWFNRLNSIESTLSTAISSLSEGLNVSNGTITMPKNRAWEQQLLTFDTQLEDFKLNRKIKSLPQKDQQMIEDLEKTYNLDTQSAYSLYKLQQGILSKAKKEGWDNKKIIFEYNRLLASCSYGIIPLKGENSKNWDDFKVTDDSSYVATRWQALCQTEDWKTTKKLLQQYGLSLSEINHLRKAISVQHELANQGYYKKITIN